MSLRRTLARVADGLVAAEIPNNNHVPLKQWRKWTPTQRRFFNLMFYTLRHESTFRHPKEVRDEKHWSTIRWNVSWEAAFALAELEKP